MMAVKSQWPIAFVAVRIYSEVCERERQSWNGVMLNCCQIRGQLANLDEQQWTAADAGQSRSLRMVLLQIDTQSASSASTVGQQW